jgi:hypothetical protein
MSSRSNRCSKSIYRKGGEISDRQWQDVLGVLRVQAGTLDGAYLAHMAEEVGVSDLLDEAVDEAGGEERR